MPAATLEDFKTAYPEFEDENEVFLTRYLNDAAIYVGDNWGEHQAQGQMYYAAHVATVNKREADGALVSSIGSGSHKVSFDLSASSGVDFSSSRYGRLYLALRNRLFGHYVAAV